MAPPVEVTITSSALGSDCHFSKGGFTFIELMIAGTMIAVLFVSLAAHLRGGITVWRETTQRVEQMQQEQDALDRLARDLEKSVSYYDKNDIYDQAGLPQPLFEADTALWYAVEAQHGARVLSYKCATVDDAEWLVRTNQTLEEVRAQAQAGGDPPPLERLLPGCTSLTLQYAYLPDDTGPEALIWKPNWPDADPAAEGQLPRLVEVLLTLEGGRQLQRVVAIPQGRLKTYDPTSS